MSGSEHARPVWLTEADADEAPWLRARWDAAPADPTEALAAALLEWFGPPLEDVSGYEADRDDLIEAVLRALGSDT